MIKGRDSLLTFLSSFAFSFFFRFFPSPVATRKKRQKFRKSGECFSLKMVRIELKRSMGRLIALEKRRKLKKTWRGEVMWTT